MAVSKKRFVRKRGRRFPEECQKYKKDKNKIKRKDFQEINEEVVPGKMHTRTGEIRQENETDYEDAKEEKLTKKGREKYCGSVEKRCGRVLK